jgi:succinate dehydrogenase/fumarate reductase iron-sulfur protein
VTAEPRRSPVEVIVGRSDDRSRRTFRVDRSGPMVILDLLVSIQRDHDPTLAFRYSCRIGACGTCTVQVDGRPALACLAIVGDAVGAIRIEPLGGLPVIRDLIIDLAPFQDRWIAVMPQFEAAGTASGELPVEPQSPERRAIDPNLDCIGCGACFAACGLAAAGLPFLGPAALNRAYVLASDSRDGASDERMAVVGGSAGLDGCHGIGACTVVCPKGLDPAGSIRRLRRMRLTPDRPGRPARASSE